MHCKSGIFIGILEDNRGEQLTLENAIYEVAEKNNIKAEVRFTADNWKQFMDKLSTESVNTCLLDIDINDAKINGMDIAAQIDEMGKGIKIIFLTAYDSYMSSAFKVSAFDYLVKPLNKEDLRRTLLRLQNKLSINKECLEILAQEYIRIPYKDIIYLTYEDRRVKIVTTTSVETLPSTYTLKEVVASLPQDKFVECSSSSCVNINYVKRFKGSEIELSIEGMQNLKNEYATVTSKMYTSKSGGRRMKGFLKKFVKG